MISAKLATLALLKLKIFSNNGYGVIIFVHDVTNKILSGDSNYIIENQLVINQSLITLEFL